MERPRPNKFALFLLTLIVVFQPMVSFALTLPGQHVGTSSNAPVMEDCPKAISFGAATDQADEKCEGMTLESCSLATSQGNCGLSTILLPAGEFKQVIQSTSDQLPIAVEGDYRSIILDTLTPPPNTSIA
ncbi:MAG TPA: hypothetical protein ENH62_16970 [Marinobacter sp.]|uniref:Uncharacterized protein n=1 Tax=Marinobacter antarcticus TaxID=564117 RepID=A0A831R588_9GAMM|nr:hypothetical protein [Marinobacter antarcticus]HDZ39936.1 hypothetical protein [Marinobacter sp.]HEA53172.1 hypothetical protein [Marinobacter antarcticus]